MKAAWPLIALLAAGCSSAPTYPSAPSRPTALPLDVSPPSLQVPAVDAKDSCGAAELQGLVGHLRTEIPVPVQPNRQRVACTTCPVTMDYRPDRLNFFFEAETGRIKEIRCG